MGRLTIALTNLPFLFFSQICSLLFFLLNTFIILFNLSNSFKMINPPNHIRKRSSFSTVLQLIGENETTLLNTKEEGSNSIKHQSNLKRSATVIGYHVMAQKENLWKELPKVPDLEKDDNDQNKDFSGKNDEDEEEQTEQETMKTKTRQIKRVFSSPNRLSMLRPSPIKLNRLPNWISNSISRSPSLRSPSTSIGMMSPKSSSSCTSNEEMCESKTTYFDLSPSSINKKKKSTPFLSPIWSSKKAYFHSSSFSSSSKSQGSYSPKVEEKGQENESNDRKSIQESLDTIWSQESGEDGKTTSCEEDDNQSISHLFNLEKDGDEQNQSFESSSIHSQEPIEELNSDLEKTVEQSNCFHHFENRVIDNTSTRAQKEQNEMTFDEQFSKQNSLFISTLVGEEEEKEEEEEENSSPIMSHFSEQKELEQTKLQEESPLSSDSSTSTVRQTGTLCNPLLELPPGFKRTISTDTNESCAEEQSFFSACSSTIDLHNLQQNDEEIKGQDVEKEEEVTSSKREEEHQQDDENLIEEQQSQPSTPSSSTSANSSNTTISSTSTSPENQQTSNCLPPWLSEFVTHSYWSDDSEEEEEGEARNNGGGGGALRQMVKVKNRLAGENKKNTNLIRFLGFDQSQLSISSTSIKRRSSSIESTKFENSFLELDPDLINSKHQQQQQSKLFSTLQYVPQILRNRATLRKEQQSQQKSQEESTSISPEIQTIKNALELDIHGSDGDGEDEDDKKQFPLRRSSSIRFPSRKSRILPHQHFPINSFDSSTFLVKNEIINPFPFLSDYSHHHHQPKYNRLLHKPSLPALVEGRTLVQEENENEEDDDQMKEDKDKFTKHTSKIKHSISFDNLTTQKRSWHPFNQISPAGCKNQTYDWI